MASVGKPRDVWYRLMTPNGDVYDKTSADIVSLAIDSNIDQFREAVTAKNTYCLGHVVPNQLKVYMNHESLAEENQGPLDVQLKIAGLGINQKNALMVTVPYPQSKRPKLNQPEKDPTSSNWFSSDFVQSEPPVTLSTGEWMSMAYNGNVIPPMNNEVEFVLQDP